MSSDLRDVEICRLQEASAEVETKMMNFLLNYAPTQDMKVGDAKTIARFARTYAFDAFSRALDGEKG